MNRLLPLLLCCAATTAGAQVFTPKDVQLNVSFGNTGPVSALMSAPAGPGLNRVFVTSTTDPAPPGGNRQALANYLAAGPLSAPTVLAVDDTENGLTYKTQVLCELNNGQQYYFLPVSGLSTSGAAPVWNIQETGTVVTFQFRNQFAAPVMVDGGIILAEDISPTPLAPGNLYLTPSTTQATFLARGGGMVRFNVYVDLGGNNPAGGKYRKKYTIETYVAAALPSNTSLTIPVIIDTAANTSGSLSGRFDVTRSDVAPSAPATTDDGNFEIHAPTPIPGDSRPDFPLIHVDFNAGDGYGNWERHRNFSGTNFSTESSGSFTASSLLPTPPPGGGFYSAYGETFLRRSVPGNLAGVYGLQFLRTPALGSGTNPAPLISAGNLYTGDTFVIRPGILQGSITLNGPPALAGQPAMLAHVARSTSSDTNGDGLPDSDVTEWFSGSRLWVNGLDTLAPGATNTASGGQAFMPLPGSFISASDRFQGQYQLALGGLNSEASFWKSDNLTLSMVNQGADADTYFSTTYTMLDRRDDTTLRREIQTDGTATFDISRDFGEVCLLIRSATGTIYQPDIQSVTDDPDYPANAVGLVGFTAFGWPVNQSAAATTGSLRTLLPAGHWILHPRVNPGNQPPGSNVDLLSIKVSVPARGRLCLETGFQIQSTIPACLTGAEASITGIVETLGTVVTSISYSIDGGAPVILSQPNAANPAFSIDLAALADGIHEIIITATGPDGRESVLSGSFFRNAAGLTSEPAVILRWTCGVLQTSTDMINWTDVPGATSPFAVPTSDPRRFWQLRPGP